MANMYTTSSVLYTTTTTTSLVVTVLTLSAILLVQAQDTGLSAGVEEILSFPPYVDTFDCTGRDYGYYADMDNNCEVFHVCLPERGEEGEIVSSRKFSFVCPNQTAFDQEYLACNHKEDAFPCEESASLYGQVPYGLPGDYDY